MLMSRSPSATSLDRIRLAAKETMIRSSHKLDKLDKLEELNKLVKRDELDKLDKLDELDKLR